MFEIKIDKKGSISSFSKIMYLYKYFTNLKVAYHIAGAL
jgi:hypothetical protein